MATLNEAKAQAIIDYCRDCRAACGWDSNQKMNMVNFANKKPCRYKKVPSKKNTWGFVVTAMLIAVAAHAEQMNLTASWYSTESLKREGQWARTKGVMADGTKFSDGQYTCASWDYRLGQTLIITNVLNGRRVTVRNCDRTARRFKGKRIDLSPSAFNKIARLEQGIVPCVVEEVK